MNLDPNLVGRLTNSPLAATGLKSYRYRGRYGWVMIGAKDDDDALREAARSIGHEPDIRQLERWEDEFTRPGGVRGHYVPVGPITRARKLSVVLWMEHARLTSKAAREFYEAGDMGAATAMQELAAADYARARQERELFLEAVGQ